MDNLSGVFARNCSVRRIDKAASDSFLNAYHRLGATGGRYRYGLFVERSTGPPRPRFRRAAWSPWLCSPMRGAGSRTAGASVPTNGYATPPFPGYGSSEAWASCCRRS